MITEYDPAFGCEIAQGRRDRDGYVRDGDRLAHRVAWERSNGSVPEGIELDHTCRRRACRALIHLEPVTRGENEKRKHWAYRSKIKSCPAGHALAAVAIVTPEGGRVCRTCRDEARQAP